MNVGLLFPFRNPPRWHVPWAEFYAVQLAQIREAEGLGYDTVWLSEHHFVEDGYSPSLMTIAAAVAAQTNRIRIGTFLMLLPLHHPVQVAEDAATVDIISNGRLDLGVGQGYVPAEFDGYGISRNERGARLREGIEIVRGLWSGRPFTYEGTHFQLRDVQLAPPPVQHPHPPLWAGAERPVGIERAARLGCHFLTNGDPGMQRLYDQTLRDEGRDPSGFSIAQLRWAHIAPSREQAWDDCQEHLHYMLSLYTQWSAASADHNERARRQLPPMEELRDSDLARGLFIGTPADVAEQIAAFTAGVRTTHLVLGMHLPGLDPAKSRRSMQLFASEILPALHSGRAQAETGRARTGGTG